MMAQQASPNTDRTWRIESDHGPGPVLADRNLVPASPNTFNAFNCPHCGKASPRADRTLYIGIQVITEYTCAACGKRFFRDLPIGFQNDLPLAFDSASHKPLHWNAEQWITYPEYTAPTSLNFTIERKVFQEHKRVIVLNALDHLYGHVLLKLYNAPYYLDHYKDRGLVLLIPKMFEWLVPKGVAEIWVVDQKLSQARAWHPCIDAFVQQQLPRYDDVQLARCWLHPVLEENGIERFTGVQPFPLKEFTVRAPHMTFVARTDRLWFSSPLNKFIYRALKVLGPKNALRRAFVGKQTRMIARSMRAIKAAVPDVTFTVVGLAPPGGLDHLATDLRTTSMSKETELAWCRAYANSHIVVGVHGSNMLLPTAHAAAMIEILPHDRAGNIGQDVSIRFQDRMQLFLYRFVDEFAGPGEIARQAIAIFRYFTLYRRNNQVNVFKP